MSDKQYAANIFPAMPVGFAGLADHDAVECIQRYVPEGFPVHLAIHQVSVDNGKNAALYSVPHMHPDEDEINVLTTASSLVYDISIGGQIHRVAAPVAIWLPAGLEHSANVVSGEGSFLCLRFQRDAATGLPRTGSAPECS